MTVYFAVTNAEKKTIKVLGHKRVAPDFPKSEMKNLANNNIESNASTPGLSDVYLPDGRVRRFVPSSLGKGICDIFTYSAQTGRKTDYTQYWLTTEKDETVRHLRYTESKKSYILKPDEELWTEVITNDKKPAEKIKIDPWTFLPVK
jgi:hypothetical protein